MVVKDVQVRDSAEKQLAACLIIMNVKESGNVEYSHTIDRLLKS